MYTHTHTHTHTQGGYGMNSGAADAFELAWRLIYAIKYNHENSPGLLKSYELERYPVMIKMRDESLRHSRIYNIWSKQFNVNLLDNNDNYTINKEEAKLHKEEMKKSVESWKNRGENDSLGIEIGYRYCTGKDDNSNFSKLTTQSPLCISGANLNVVDKDDMNEPEWNRLNYIPSTYPGCRPPSVWLQTDSSINIFDSFDGIHFILLRFDQNINIDKFLNIAHERNLPLKVKDINAIEEPRVTKLYEKKLVMVRPDMIVCWRSNIELDNDIIINNVLENILGYGTEALKCLDKYKNMRNSELLKLKMLKEKRMKGFGGENKIQSGFSSKDRKRGSRL